MIGVVNHSDPSFSWASQELQKQLDEEKNKNRTLEDQWSPWTGCLEDHCAVYCTWTLCLVDRQGNWMSDPETVLSYGILHLFWGIRGC